MWVCLFRGIFPLFLLNILMRSSPACSRKKIMASLILCKLGNSNALLQTPISHHFQIQI
jgi:hypothetical protein